MEQPTPIRRSTEGGSHLVPEDAGEEFHLGFNGSNPAVDRHDDSPALKSHPLHCFLVELLLHLTDGKVAENGAGYHDAKGEEEEDPASEGGAEIGNDRRHGGYGSYTDALPTKAPSFARMISSRLGMLVSGLLLAPLGPMLYRSKSELIGCRLWSLRAWGRFPGRP